jgi:hypothetical protein
MMSDLAIFVFISSLALHNRTTVFPEQTETCAEQRDAAESPLHRSRADLSCGVVVPDLFLVLGFFRGVSTGYTAVKMMLQWGVFAMGGGLPAIDTEENCVQWRENC